MSLYTRPSLPNLEIFYRTAESLKLDVANGGVQWTDGDGNPLGEGWFYWYCNPGCLPDTDPIGPFSTELAALEAAHEEADVPPPSPFFVIDHERGDYALYGPFESESAARKFAQKLCSACEMMGQSGNIYWAADGGTIRNKAAVVTATPQ